MAFVANLFQRTSVVAVVVEVVERGKIVEFPLTRSNGFGSHGAE
jgi:hypothetical protein